MTRISETNMELFKVTQWKDDCIFKTKSMGEVWITSGLSGEEQRKIAKSLGGDFFASLSLGRLYEECFRTRIV